MNRAVLALLLAAASWATSWSWSPLVAQPHRYLTPGLAVAALVAVLGSAARARLPVVLAVLVQAVVPALVVVAWFAPVAGVPRLPTPHTIAAVVRLAVDGAQQINAYTAPVPARFTAAPAFLAVCTLGLALAVDVVGCTVRRVPVTGLLLLLGLSVPISVLVQDLAPAVFVVVAAGFLAAMALDHAARSRSWGRPARAAGTRGIAVGRHRSVAAPLIAATAVLGSLVLAGLTPVPAGIWSAGGHSSGGDGTDVTLANPMLDIRRDLLEHTHTPLVGVRTDAPDPSYLQLTVLDDFTGNIWRTSPRALPSGNAADGVLPTAPGTDPRRDGAPTHWELSIADTFGTRWLPVPTPTRTLSVTGDWRYDARTLDIVDVGEKEASRGLTYRATAGQPRYDAATLDAAGAPVGPATDGMTALPGDLPPVLARTAREVTRGARTEYQQAVALQNWFRDTGHFTYSTAARPGTGAALLARFVTVDRVGYCEQFSTAMAVLARTLGIPSRVVVGFLRPTGQGAGDQQVFTSDDLHAWPELYFAGAGWVRFEPTPAARTGAPPAFTQQRLQPRPSARPSPTAQPNPRTRRSPRPSPVQQPRTTASSDGVHVPWTPIVLVLVLGLLALPRLARSRRRQRWLAGAGRSGLAHGAWQELRATALDHGLGWPEGASPRTQAAHLRSRVSSDLDDVAALTRLTAFVEHARYGRPGPATRVEDAAEARAVVEDVQRWRRLVRAAVSPRTARRARWWPPSMVDRPTPPPVLTEDEDSTPDAAATSHATR
ncbi:MAG: transglutaminaseTgpA domain-containing protein [Marmoricola sp.]